MTSVKNHLRGHTELFSSFFLLHKSNINGGIWQKRKPALRVKKEKTLQKGSECNSVKMIVKFTAFIRGANRTKYGIWWGNGGSEKNNCLNLNIYPTISLSSQVNPNQSTVQLTCFFVKLNFVHYDLNLKEIPC